MSGAGVIVGLCMAGAAVLAGVLVWWLLNNIFSGQESDYEARRDAAIQIHRQERHQ